MSSGQATLELVVSAALISLTLIGSGWLLKAQWNRGRCAYLVFETAHARLTGRLEKGRPASVRIQVSESAEAVESLGECGQAREKITLPRLEEQGS